MKILIIRFSSIGDIVLTTPVIRCLKTQVKDAEIHFLSKEIFSDLLVNNPYIDKLHLLNKSFKDTLKQLKDENFDYIIDLHNNIRTFRVKINLRKKSASFNKLNMKKWMLVQFKINLLPEIHIVDRYFETCKYFNITNDNKGLDFFIPDDEYISKNQLPKNFQDNFGVLVIGGKHFTKQIPDTILIELCKTTKIPLILLGGKEDRIKAEQIRKQAENSDIFNACGSFSINQSASIIEQSQLVITSDTGLMHIASAFNKKIISVWGNTVPEFGMYPYLPNEQKAEIIENKSLKCRPCSKIGFEKCPKNHFDCMNKIDISLIKKHLQ